MKCDRWGKTELLSLVVYKLLGSVCRSFVHIYSVSLGACLFLGLHVCVPRYMWPASSNCFLRRIHLYASGCQTIITQHIGEKQLFCHRLQVKALYVS